MNKKFSTLVASLLVSSTFGVYNVGAVPVLANQTQIETRAVSADVEEAEEFTGALPNYSGAANYAGHVLKSGFTNNARIAYIGEAGATPTAEQYVFVNIAGNQFHISAGGYNYLNASDYYWTLNEGELVANNGAKFAPQRLDDYVEVVPVTKNGEATEFFAIARRNADGSRSYVKWNSSSYFEWSEPTVNTASLFISVETAFNTELNGAEVNEMLGDGFNLFVSSARDENATISKADVFSGKLTAVADNKTDLATTSDADYYLRNADGKFIVFEQDGDITSDLEAIKGDFKLVSANDAGNPTTATSDKIYNQFVFISADNGSGLVEVRMGAKMYRLYNARVNDTYALTLASYTNASIDAADWTVTSFNLGNLVDLREFLTGDFYTVDFVKSMDDPADANDEYKKGGRLAIRENGTTDYADYVDAESLYEKAPEAQWAVTTPGVNDGKPYFNNVITLTNRENPGVTVTINTLRRAEDGSGFVVVGAVTPNAPTESGVQIAGLTTNDVVRINAVTNHKPNDGYAEFSDNDLRNETYHLGQIRQTADGDINVYWAENHAASHQIGATVEQANATKWNLSLVKKANAGADFVGQTDSILVVSELQNWVAANQRIETKKDTLVILPYAFQNRSNSEFAEFNNGTNLEYYQCNVYDKDEAKVYKYGVDAMFALKRKADVNGQPVYNYVMLNARTADDYAKGNVIANVDDAYASVKVYQENSTDRGTWKNMQMYAGDANALMFVNRVDAPEYRKLVADAALDTISIYRGDNDHQVVYEKAGVSLNGRTLSFLNVDNDVQFTDINPALYADSAYVNRGNNTRWQYLLGVNIEHHEGYYCPDHGFRPTDDCEHSVWVSYNTGRYLINMIDTANVYGQTAGIHNNPYINETEEGNQCAKLSFVDAIHVLADGVNPEMADKLYVINGTEEGDTTVLDLGADALNVAKFAFKYTDSMESDEFKIQTQWKDYDPANYGTDDYAAPTEEGYLRWVNGCIVVDDEYAKGDVFNMDENETRTPTANEEISAEAGAVSVVATDGAIIVKGAEGKNVVVATILGKIVANEVATSDNETIAVPAGIAVVAVDGESFKVVVK